MPDFLKHLPLFSTREKYVPIGFFFLWAIPKIYVHPLVFINQ